MIPACSTPSSSCTCCSRRRLWALLRPSVRAAVGCAVAAIAWVVWSGPIEGAVLASITPDHGVTESDLLGAAALLIAVERCPRAPVNEPGRSPPLPEPPVWIPIAHLQLIEWHLHDRVLTQLVTVSG